MSTNDSTATDTRKAGPVPTVGRDVHQVARGSADGVYDPEIRPAKITKVYSDEVVSLVIWTENGTFHATSVPRHDGEDAEEPSFSPFYRCPVTGRAYPGGTWHWPPRVGP